ncbi:MAG TPA: sugar phosphate nucleotidyltransferase [Thermomicrobiales bacterium]|nr:sugar phosphate nucleotidyltransferase [Thermomicrobiales bacterium]
MDIILPVAGLGTRLRPQTWSKPKPLVSVGGKPMLAHVLDRVLLAHPEKLVFITGYRGDQIEEWARANYDQELVFVEQPQMLGQTDAIIRTRDYVKGDALILFPDMIFEADFTNLGSVDADVVAYTKEVDDPSAFGIAVLQDERIVKLVEKPQEPVSNLALIGVYYIKHMPDLYQAMDEQMERGMTLKNEYFLADAIQLMIDHGATAITAPVSVWEDCGNAEALLSTNRYLLDHQGKVKTLTFDSAKIVQPSVIAPDAVLERAVVGPYASIGSGVTIRDAVVRDAIIDDGSTIESAVINHSVIGKNVEITGRAHELNAGDTAVIDL